MKRLHILLVVWCSPAWAQLLYTGVFESCPQCRLDAMPELKRFLHDSVVQGEYGEQLTVKFVPGAVPTLIIYRPDGQEVSREEVSGKFTTDELHSWVQSKGFSRTLRNAAKTAAGVTDSSAATAAAPMPPLALHERRRMRRRHASAAATKAAAIREANNTGGVVRMRVRLRRRHVRGRRRRVGPHAKMMRRRGTNGTQAGPNGKMLRMRRKKRVKRAAARGEPARPQ